MSVSAASEREISRPEFIALIAALMALNALAIDVMLPALPFMGEALKVVNENDRQLVLSAYLIGFGLAQLVYGPITDRFGRRAPLFVGIAIYVATVFCALIAPNYATLLGLRFIQGLGAAGTRVIALSVVRDRFAGRKMAEVMALVFMVFMIIPIVAPSIGQVILLTGPWTHIFIFMGGLASVIGLWAYARLPETLPAEKRRPFSLGAIASGFRMVFSDRTAVSYALASTFVFGALFGFINTAQQIYVDIYGLGSLFPLAFAVVAGLMSVSSFLNSRFVGRLGMRRLSHFALLSFTAISGIWLVLSLFGNLPFLLFLGLFAAIMFMFGWTGSNMNSLAMEPLGAVAGTASSVFGFMQTVGGAVIGAGIGQMFNGSTTPVAAGYFFVGLIAIACVLFAERGKLFGVGEEYQ
ncbi:MAG TPA: multidrug effflux MFS transporter [Devosiaceae bacterium]